MPRPRRHSRPTHPVTVVNPDGRRRILFIGGALNQTKIAHAVATDLAEEYDVAFSPCYADSGLPGTLSQMGLLEWTALGGIMKSSSLEYLRDHGASVDDGGRLGPYDLVVTTTDLIVPKNIRAREIVLLQEGMTDPDNMVARAVHRLKLPRYLASTASFGLSHNYRYLCAASTGYKEKFAAKGIDPGRIVVTGLPGWDRLDRTRPIQGFPHRDYVLVATSDARETFKVDRRRRFLRRCLEIAGHRPLVFKLHPNENFRRAKMEIRQECPGATVYTTGDVNGMIAGASELITQYSTLVYQGIALGIPVHSSFDVGELGHLLPLQNGGTSASAMADVCRHVLDPSSTGRNLADVCQCGDCRAGSDRLHATA